MKHTKLESVSTIAEALNALAAEAEYNLFLGMILTEISKQINVDDIHLFLYDKVSHTLKSYLAVQDSIVYSGNAPGDPEIFFQTITAEIASDWQIIAGSIKLFTQHSYNPDIAEFYCSATQGWHNSRGHQSVNCACMEIGGHPIGLITFSSKSLIELTSQQLEFIQAFTNLAAISVYLNQISSTDERILLVRKTFDTMTQTFTNISLQLEVIRSIATLTNEGAALPPGDLMEILACTREARSLAITGLAEVRHLSRTLASYLDKNVFDRKSGIISRATSYVPTD